MAGSSVAQDMPQKEVVDIVLVMGQSNASGHGWPMDSEDHEGSPYVWKWWIDGKVYQGAAEPFGNDSEIVAVGPGLAFGKEWVRLHPGRHVIVVMASQGNTMLSQWEKGTPLYNRALDRVRPVLTSGTLIGVIWHQGEGDAIYQDQAESYEVRLKRMFSDLRGDLGMGNLPFVCGGLGDFLSPSTFAYRPKVNGGLQDLTHQLSRVGFVSSEGLTSNGDSVHFSAAGQRYLGTKYAAMLTNMSTAAADADWNRYE